MAQPQTVSSVKTCLGANWDALVCVLRLTRGPAGCLHANATKLTVHSCLLILIWAAAMQACSKELYWSTTKSFLKIYFFVREKSSEAQRGRSRPVFNYTVFLKRTRAWKQLSSWAIPALTNHWSLMSSICKKHVGVCGGGVSEGGLWSQKLNQMYILSRLTCCEALQNVLCLKKNKYHCAAQGPVCFCCVHCLHVTNYAPRKQTCG